MNRYYARNRVSLALVSEQNLPHMPAIGSFSTLDIAPSYKSRTISATV